MKQFTDFVYTPPDVKKDKNKKTITVTADLFIKASGIETPKCPIKIIASEEAWLNLADVFLNSFGRQSFPALSVITPYISKRTSKENYALLRRYYEDDPEGFAWMVYGKFIEPAVGKIKVIRPRGGSPHDKNWEEMDKIKMASQWIYCFLSYWAKKNRKDYPECLRLYGTITPQRVITITMNIIKQKFNLDINKIESTTFYDKYIAHESLSTIKQALKTVNYLPIRYPLSQIFLKY